MKSLNQHQLYAHWHELFMRRPAKHQKAMVKRERINVRLAQVRMHTLNDAELGFSVAK